MRVELCIWDVDPTNEGAFYAMYVVHPHSEGNTRTIPSAFPSWEVENLPTLTVEDSATAQITRPLMPTAAFMRDWLALPGEPLRLLARLPGLANLVDIWPGMARIPMEGGTYAFPLVKHLGEKGGMDDVLGRTIHADHRGEPLGEIEREIERCVRQRNALAPLPPGFPEGFQHIPLESFSETETHPLIYGNGDAVPLMIYGDLGTKHAHESLERARKNRFEQGLEYRFDFSLAGGRMILWSLGEYAHRSDIVDEVHACVCETNRLYGRRPYPPIPSLTASSGGLFGGYKEVRRILAAQGYGYADLKRMFTRILSSGA